MTEQLKENINYIKTMDEDIYYFFLDFVNTIKLLTINSSFYMFLGALFEKTIFYYVQNSKDLFIPRNAINSNSSLFLLLDKPSISLHLYEMGLENELIKFINTQSTIQKHAKDTSKDHRISRVQEETWMHYSKVQFLKIYLYFSNAAYNRLFDCNNEVMSDEQICELYLGDDILKRDEAIQTQIMKELHEVVFENSAPNEIVCSCDEHMVVDGFAGRNDIISVSFSQPKSQIGSEAFRNCVNLKSVDFTNVEHVGASSFKGCINLEFLENMHGVSSFGRGAFSGCESLQNFHVPNGVVKVANEMFSDCINLENIELPNSLFFIGYCAFENCKNLKNIKLPNQIKVIDYSAFFRSGLKIVELPRSIKEIGHWAFGFGFSSNPHSDIKLIYNGTIEDWKKVKIDREYREYLETNIEFMK